MAFVHTRRRRFGTCPCRPVPRGLPSSVKQLRTTQPFGLSRSWRTLARQPPGTLQRRRMKTHHKSTSNGLAFSMVSIQFRRASCCYKSQLRYEIGRALMVSWTVGAEGIAQKVDSAEEMHPEQNEIQPARGPPRDFFSAAFECDFLVRLRTRLSSCADARANS